MQIYLPVGVVRKYSKPLYIVSRVAVWQDLCSQVLQKVADFSDFLKTPQATY